jgi:hypothetical protein
VCVTTRSPRSATRAVNTKASACETTARVGAARCGGLLLHARRRTGQGRLMQPSVINRCAARAQKTRARSRACGGQAAACRRWIGETAGRGGPCAMLEPTGIDGQGHTRTTAHLRLRSARGRRRSVVELVLPKPAGKGGYTQQPDIGRCRSKRGRGVTHTAAPKEITAPRPLADCAAHLAASLPAGACVEGADVATEVARGCQLAPRTLHQPLVAGRVIGVGPAGHTQAHARTQARTPTLTPTHTLTHARTVREVRRITGGAVCAGCRGSGHRRDTACSGEVTSGTTRTTAQRSDTSRAYPGAIDGSTWATSPPRALWPLARRATRTRGAVSFAACPTRAHTATDSHRR